MIKLFGCLMIITCGILTGFFYIKSLNKRIEILSFFIKLLEEMKIIIEYKHLSIPEILEGCNNSVNNIFLKKCLEKIKNGTSLKTAWNDSLKENAVEMCLNENDLMILSDFVICLGETDISGQISNIVLYADLLEKRIKDANKQIKEKSKVAMSCCFFGGAIIVILLI